MFDFIPIQYYTDIYYNIVLLIILVTWLHTKSFTGFTKDTYIFSKLAGILLFWIILLYMGLRPLSSKFGDMGVYAYLYDMYANDKNIIRLYDPGFYALMKVLSFFQSQTFFFFAIAFLYITPLYIASKRLFKRYAFFGFLILISSFSFWSFGTNGIRNGLATSLIILAFSYMNKKWVMYLLFFIASTIHSSVLIPIIAYFISARYHKSSFYFKLWLGSIVLSLVAGSQIEHLIANLGAVQDDKLVSYFNNKDAYADNFSSTGFRWDFLIYSASAVVTSYYFIFIQKINDKYYAQLTHIYLLSNSLWILLIKASFSNRFAYLSWFMMGLIIIYPYLQKIYWKNQFSIIGRITLLYFLFTYLMNFIVPNLKG